ncbi:helix-turn-helix domain-containing protein [Actinomadura atramentaria]|uniref:helix-turn-helix domain-containing protein n=1 Tax=Actinomadura atramentaria TaxID=1990 RepID=UPI0003A49B9E|nr:helix-turn-helix domain-containing protein [Actinomadura atramentaria]
MNRPRRPRPSAQTVLDWIIEHHGEPCVRTPDIATALSTTPRILREVCADWFGQTPFGLLTAVRVHHAHVDLLKAAPAHGQVTAISRAHGFTSPDMFGHHYLRQYGARPSETLRDRRVRVKPYSCGIRTTADARRYVRALGTDGIRASGAGVTGLLLGEGMLLGEWPPPALHRGLPRTRSGTWEITREIARVVRWSSSRQVLAVSCEGGPPQPLGIEPFAQGDTWDDLMTVAYGTFAVLSPCCVARAMFV